MKQDSETQPPAGPALRRMGAAGMGATVCGATVCGATAFLACCLQNRIASRHRSRRNPAVDPFRTVPSTLSRPCAAGPEPHPALIVRIGIPALRKSHRLHHALLMARALTPGFAPAPPTPTISFVTFRCKGYFLPSSARSPVNRALDLCPYQYGAFSTESPLAVALCTQPALDGDLGDSSSQGAEVEGLER